jgi:hypothetical protein
MRAVVHMQGAEGGCRNGCSNRNRTGVLWPPSSEQLLPRHVALALDDLEREARVGGEVGRRVQEPQLPARLAALLHVADRIVPHHLGAQLPVRPRAVAQVVRQLVAVGQPAHGDTQHATADPVGEPSCTCPPRLQIRRVRAAIGVPPVVVRPATQAE